MTAILRKDGKDVNEVAMKYAGEVSHFAGTLSGAAAGTYTLRILASNTKTVNFAMYETELKVK